MTFYPLTDYVPLAAAVLVGLAIVGAWINLFRSDE
jgi:hypothetical protein